MASLKDKSNKLLLGVVNNKTMEDAKNDDRVVDIDTLRQFTIPKMRKAKHELLENVSTDSVQFQREILQVLQQSFHDRKSTDRFVYSQPRLVHNAPLLNEFLEKRKAMRQDRTDKELPDTYGFIAVKSESEAKKYCAEGISIGNSSMMCLGNPAMGVYLCKHADILQPTQLFDGQSGYIVIFKIIKGKTKLMVENRVGEPLDPTPDFDCHLSKNVNVDTTTVSIQEAYESTQLYVYEYTEDLDITERPRQVVPHAVVSFRFAGTGSSQQKSATAKKVWLPSEYASRQTSSKMSPVAESALAVNSSLSKRSSTDSVLPATPQKGSSVQGGEQVAKNVMNDMSAGSDAADSGDIIWTGQLCMESAVISDVELVSYSNFNLPWHLEPWLNLDHDRIGYDEIMSYYQLELLAILPRDQECRASGKFYNYCELRPMTQMSKNFLRAVYLISKSRCGSRIKLTKGVDLIILPHCTITYQLGLCSRRPERVVLHCIIISTMSSSYQQGIMSKPLEAANQSSNEFPFNSQVLESGVDVTSNMRPVPYQENIASSHSVRQSLQFMQSYPGIPPNEQALLQRGQHGSIPFSPFPATTPGEAVHPLGLSSTADVPFSLSKQRHYDPRLARRLEMQSEFLPHISSDDVLRLNLPASDLPSALQTNAREGSVPGAEQSTLGSGSRHDSLQERIDRMQAELEARGSPLGYYQSDADTETEYSPSSRFPPRGSSSSVSEEDEELELDIIKLRRPTALGQLEKNTDEEQTNEEAMEVDEGNMADDLVDEIVRMKPLQAKAARETFGGPEQSSDSRQGKITDGEPMESISLTDCLFIDFDVEVSSSDSEETTDNSKTNADDLAVIKSSLLTSSATETVHNVVDEAAVVAKPVEDVTIQKDGLSSDSSKPAKPVEPVKISEEHPSPKEVPEILSPISCDVRSNDNSKVPVLSVDVASSPRPAEENDLSSKIAAADEVVNSEGLTSAVQPETCLDESSEVFSEGSRTVTFVETGKLSIEIHSDVPAKSTSDETVAEVLQVATFSPAPAPEEETRLVIEEEQVVSCVAKVLHRGVRRRRLPVAASKEEEEADHRMEMIWQLGLHYLAFFIDRDDDDNREIDAEEVPNIRSMTEHTNTFVNMFSKESMQESNKSKHVGLSSGAFVPGVFPATNKLNRGQQLGVSSSKCTTDVVRPKASLIVPSRRQTGRPDNQHESILSNQGLSKNFNSQSESEIRELQLLTNRINRFAPNELPAHRGSELQAGLLNPDFVVHRISELQINTRRRDLKAAKLMKICNSSPDACTGETALGALQRDQVDSSAARNFLRSPQRHLPVPSLLRNYRGRVEDQHKSFSFEVQSDSSRSSANEDRHVSSMSQDRRAQSKDQHSTMQRDQFLPRFQDHRDVQDSTLRPLSRSQDRQSLSVDRFSTTHRDKSLSRSRDFGGEFSGRYSVMPRDRSASRSQSRRDRDSVVRRGRSFSRSRSRSTVSSSRRTPVSYRNQASLIPKTDPYNAGEMTSSRSYRSASRSVSRLRRSRSRSPSRRAYSIASRSRSRSVRRRRKRHRRRGRRSSKPKRDRRRRDSRSRSLLSRYSSDSRNRSVSYDRNRSRRTSYSSSSDTGRRNCFRSGLSKKRRSRSISSSRQDSSYRCGPSSYYDDEPCYRNRTSDYRFRDDRERAHPYYYRRQDGTRARIDREDFLKVYREHRDLEELLQCLTKGQFESRRTRPILTHLTSNPLATVSMQSSPRFKSGFFQRSTFLEADDILGRREKVVDCLEDEMYSRDQVPNFYEKKAMADAFDDNFRPAATESQMSQRRSSSVVSNSPKITSSAAEPETAAEGSSDAKSGEVTEVAVSSAEISCLSFNNSQILIPFLEDVASPSVDDSVAAVDTEDSAGVKPKSEIQFCRTGKMEMKWPSHLTTVDIPVSRPEFHYAGASSGLLELISAEIISSCDPRLSPNVSSTSVYASLTHGTQNASLLQRGSSRQGLAGEDRSMEGLGEELREMAKNLKVRVHINPKFLPILADRAAIAGGSASVASLLQGRMGDLDQVQGANHETLAAQKLWQGNDPGKDRKLDTGVEKEISRKKIQIVSKLLPRSESETEGRTSLNSESRSSVVAGRAAEGQLGSSGIAGRAAEGQFGQGYNSEGKGNLIRVKVDPENRTSELNQDRLKQSELRYEMERDENERLIAEVVCGASSSGVPSELTSAESQKAAVRGAEECLPQGDLSPEFLVSIKQERHSADEGSSDESSVTGKSRGPAPADGNRVFAGSAPVTSDLPGVDQGQGLETEGSVKGGMMRDSSAYLRKQDKQKLKEEVLLLEKMVAEKKALQVERENRERNGGKMASKEKQQRTVATDDRETRKSQHKSATSTTERLQRRLLLEEKQRATATSMDRLRRHGVNERHRLGSDDRSTGLPSERQTSSVSIAPSGENKLRRDSASDNQESTQVSDIRIKPASVPCVVEEKLRKPTTSDYKEIALKPDGQEKRKIEDQGHKGDIIAAHESALKEMPKKKDSWPERQTIPALFPAFQNSNILQSKDKVPAVNIDLEQPLRNAVASQEHSRPTRPKTGTLKVSKESEEQKWEEQKRVFQSPQHNTEVKESGNISLARTPVYVADPALCSCGSKKGKKLAIEHCEFCLRRQLLGNIENITGASSSSAMSDFAKFASPESSLPSTGLQHEVVSSNVQDELVSDVDGIPLVKNSTDGESLDAVDNEPSHLPCLCPETQFESQFYDCASVRRIQLEATREWMRQKPLEMLICGRLKELPRLLPWLPTDFTNDPHIMDCLTSFSQSMNEILEMITAQEDVEGSDAEVPDTESVAAEPPEPPCATEQLANSLFEEVRQHLEFLSEKSLLQNMEVTGQPSDPVEGEVYVEDVTPRVRGPEVLPTIPVLKKPSKYSAATNNAGMETKTAHCDVSFPEVLPSHIRPHSSPQQVVRDEDKSSCHEQLSYVEDADISQTQLPTKDVVHETKIRESTVAHDYKSSFRIPHSTGNERLRERSSADVPRIPRSHETEHSWRRGAARGRDIPLRRRGFDSERNFYQNRGKESVEGSRSEHVRLPENQYRMKPSPHDSHKRRKHSRSQGDDRNDPKALTTAGKVEDHEPKRCRKEKVKEPDRDLESKDDTLEEKQANAESLEKKLEKIEPPKELDSSEVKDLRKGTKKSKKNKKERQEGDSGKKVKEKKEKKKVKKKKKTEAEKVSDQLHLEKPADTKVALSHLLSDAAESAFAQANTDSGSAFAQLNDDLRRDEKDPTSVELVETQAALDFRNLFKCPSDVEAPQVDLSLSSPPLMQCFFDKNIDYADVMHKLADVIPGTGNFDAKRLTPQTSFIWALALAVFKDEGKASEDVKGSAKLEQEFKQNLFDEECRDFADAYEVGEHKDAALESYQSLDGEAAEPGDKTSAQKSPGGRGSNLMQAFRQVVEAKRRAQELTKGKLGLSKLSPELAAKRAAPKAAKRLFKPPTTPDPKTLLSNSGSGRFKARPEVRRSTDEHLAENLARDAFMKVCLELERVLEQYCGLNNLERTVPPPLKFYLMYTHFAPLSLVAISLYRSVVSAMDDGKLAADQKMSADVDCAKESPLGSTLNSLKRKRTDTDFMMCALLKKPREQTYSTLNKEEEEILFANLAAKDVALGNNTKVVPASTKSICPTNEGSTDKEKPYCPEELFLHDYLPASDDCEGLNNSLTDESVSPPNGGNNFVGESDNTFSSVVPTTNAEAPCLTAVTDISHQRFLNAKGPRFMQTFRQNQIAKRRSQKEKENLRTATGGKLLHSKQTVTVGVVKPKPIGMTFEETLAVLSGHHSPVSSTSASVTPSTSGTSVVSTDVNTTLSTDVSAEVVPTNTSPPPKVSSEDLLPIETVTTSRSPTAAHPLQDLTTIPLPPSALPEDEFDAMDIGSPSESSVTVELGTFSESTVTVPYVTQPISCATSFSSSYLISSPSDCYSGYEVSCAPPSGHLTSYLLPIPSAQTDDTQLEDSTSAVNIQPPYSVSSAADTSQMMNSEWQYEYFPPPVDPPPVSYPSMSVEQPVQPSCIMPPHFASPRPYLLETPPDIQPVPFPCMPNELPPRYPHPCPDQRAWDNSPRPPPQPFPPPHPPQGLPWRGGRPPPPPMNMMMPPDGSRPPFRQPPPGMNPNSPIMGPKRPMLLRPPSSASGRGGLLPHPRRMPPPFAAGFRERSASDPGITREDGNEQLQPMTSASDIRMYIFNKDKAICKSIQRFLEFLGARAFDPYNIATLHLATDDICMVLIHERDFGIIHHVPNLLRLKHDNRVMFSGYYDVIDVKFKKFIPLFLTAGLIVFDNAALLSCKSESLQMLCEFVHLEGKERKSWTVVVSPQIMGIMDDHLRQENLDVETSARLAENRRLVAHFMTLGVIHQMTGRCHPLSSRDYQMKCITLQSIHCRKYRHFIFITDFPKSHPDSNLFLDCGIDMMNIPEFLNAFVGKSVDQPEQQTSGEVAAHSTRLTSDAFADSRLSSAVDSCVVV